jgi:uncharacterized membrane protein YedE/YeeE
MTDYIIALVLGVFFGLSLNKAGLTKYHKIVNVFRFTDMAVLKFMMTALVVSMTGLYALRGLGWITFPAAPATYIVGNVVGGLIFGVGMSLSGYCPGTCAAGAGEGKLDYIVPGLLGFFTGAVIFGFTYQQVFPQISALAKLGNVVMPDLWNLNPYLFVGLFAAITVLLFYLIDRAGLQREEKLAK